MDCGSTTSTNRNTNTVTEQTRPACGPIETRQHASECIIQSQGIPAQGPVNYQGAQQTDFASLSAGTSAGEHSFSGVSGRSNLVNAGSSTCFINSRNDRITYTFGLNSVLGAGLRGSVTNPHLNRENNHNLSNDCSLGANSTQATSGSRSSSSQSQVLNRADTLRVAEQPDKPLLGRGGMGSVSGLPQVQGHNSHHTWGPRPAFLNQTTP